jgi:hypothetical protein
VGYEPQYERFEAKAADGPGLPVEFRRAGFLTAGDNPELYFFQVGQKEVVVGISGGALKRAEQKRRFSREEKIDLAGLWLKRKIEAGAELESKNLFLRDEELAEVAGELGIQGMAHR